MTGRLGKWAASVWCVAALAFACTALVIGGPRRPRSADAFVASSEVSLAATEAPPQSPPETTPLEAATVHLQEDDDCYTHCCEERCLEKCNSTESCDSGEGARQSDPSTSIDVIILIVAVGGFVILLGVRIVIKYEMQRLAKMEELLQECANGGGAVAPSTSSAADSRDSGGGGQQTQDQLPRPPDSPPVYEDPPSYHSIIFPQDVNQESESNDATLLEDTELPAYENVISVSPIVDQNTPPPSQEDASGVKVTDVEGVHKDQD